MSGRKLTDGRQPVCEIQYVGHESERSEWFMSEEIKLGKYTFAGPFDGARFLYNRPGVVVILCRDIRETGKFYLIDIDEGDDVRTMAMNHPRQVDWVKAAHGVGKLALGVYYSDIMKKEDRQKMVGYMRSVYDMPCKPKS